MTYLRIGVAVVVTIVWAVVVLGSFLEGRSAPPELSGIMLAVVTALFTAEVKQSIRRRRREIAEAIKPKEEPHE